MTYYKTSCAIFDRVEDRPAYVVSEDGGAILEMLKSRRVHVPVHQYTCDLDLHGETLQDRPDLRERGLALARAMFKAALEERLAALLDAATNMPGMEPSQPVTLVLVEKEPESLEWTGSSFHGTVTFGIAAFCWIPEELVGATESRVSFPAGFEKVDLHAPPA